MERCWVVGTESGPTARARYLILCTGIGSKPHLPDIEGRDELDIPTAVAADRVLHQPVERGIVAITIVFHALHQGAGAIADPGNRDFDLLSGSHDTPQKCST